MKQENLVFALTVAGFDGSAGAGFLADIKAMEFFGVYGQAVCTALTVQNENEFLAPNWVSFEQIEAQLDALAKVRRFKAIKIGLVESAPVLSLIVKKLKELFPDAFLIIRKLCVFFKSIPCLRQNSAKIFMWRSAEICGIL